MREARRIAIELVACVRFGQRGQNGISQATFAPVIFNNHDMTRFARGFGNRCGGCFSLQFVCCFPLLRLPCRLRLPIRDRPNIRSKRRFFTISVGLSTGLRVFSRQPVACS